MLAWAWVARFGAGSYSLYLGSFCLLLWLVALLDWRTLHIYDVVTLPAAAAGLCGSLFFPLAFDGQRWQSAVAMAGMGACMLALQQLGRLYAKREALGGGDVKLMVAAAGFLGFPLAWMALLLGALLGIPLMLLYQRAHGLGWREAAPFGPALALACGLAAWDQAAGGLLARTLNPFY